RTDRIPCPDHDAARVCRVGTIDDAATDRKWCATLADLCRWPGGQSAIRHICCSVAPLSAFAALAAATASGLLHDRRGVRHVHAALWSCAGQGSARADRLFRGMPPAWLVRLAE